MPPRPNPDLFAGNLAFLAKQAAGQSHELTNVFNVINELAGLLGDTLEGLAAGKNVDPQRLLALPGRIADQVKRGEGLVRLVNQFVHTADAPWAVVDLRDALAQAASLVARRARLCRSEVRTVLPAAGLAMETSPLGLMNVVVTALELVLEPLAHEPAEGGVLELGGTSTDGMVEITIRHSEGLPLGPLAESALDGLTRALESLGASQECRRDSQTNDSPDLSPTILALRFPRGLDSQATPGPNIG